MLAFKYARAQDKGGHLLLYLQAWPTSSLKWGRGSSCKGIENILVRRANVPTAFNTTFNIGLYSPFSQSTCSLQGMGVICLNTTLFRRPSYPLKLNLRSYGAAPAFYV